MADEERFIARSSIESDLAGIFTDEELSDQPTIYDHLPAPETIPGEVRVKTASDIFIEYDVARRTFRGDADAEERLDIELNAFLSWIKLTDEEYDEAKRIADESIESKGE